MNKSCRLSAILAVAVSAVIIISLIAILHISVSSVFAADYEKSQIIVQTNECGNYWFPLDVLCSNLSSQVQGDENGISIASAQEQEDGDKNDESSKSYGPPFP